MWVADHGKDVEFSLLVDPNTTAIIVIDVQNDFCHPQGAFGGVGHDNSIMPDLAAALHKLLAEARRREVLTIFVRATYDREVTSRPLARHRRRLGLMESLCLEGSWGADWYGGIEPNGAPNEVVLTKHRFDAFQGTPLDLYLRSNGIRTVIVTGVVTSGCVESTVRDAFFLDYCVVVPSDGVAESQTERHDIALEVMQRSFASVSNIDQIVSAWARSNAPVEPSWRPEARRQRAVSERSADGLLLIDAGDLAGPQRECCDRLRMAAAACGVPIFDVRSVVRGLGRTAFETLREEAALPEAGAAQPGSVAEMVIDKMRRSGFGDTRLGLLLRTNGVRHLVIAGCDTVAGSLVATGLDGLDADYAVTLVQDALAGEVSPAIGAGATPLQTDAVIEGWREARAGRAGVMPAAPSGDLARAGTDAIVAQR